MTFDEYAIDWDTERRKKRSKIVAKEIRKEAEITKKDKCLEFGCGTGLISINLYQYSKKIDLLDTSEEMLARVEAKIKNKQINNMGTIYLDITKDDVLENKYDVIYTSMVLHHIKNINAIIKNFYKMLNKSGRLCIVDLNNVSREFHKNELDFDAHDGFDTKELKEILENSGFINVKVKTFYESIKKIEEKEIQYSLFIISAEKGKSKVF